MGINIITIMILNSRIDNEKLKFYKFWVKNLGIYNLFLAYACFVIWLNQEDQISNFYIFNHIWSYYKKILTLDGCE